MFALTCWVILIPLLPLQDDPEECRKAQEAFRTAYRSDQESRRIEAAINLGRHPCTKSVDVLAALLTGEVDGVRIAAARAVSGIDIPKSAQVLALAVPPNAERHEPLEAIAQGIERLNWEMGAETLNPLLGKHHDKDVLETLHVVVPVLGRLGSESSVLPLIKLLEHAENESQRTRAAGVRAAGNPKMQALEAPIRKALTEITGGNEPNSDRWSAWWKGNRERLVGNASLIYRCKTTAKRWEQKAQEPQACPFHAAPEKDGQLVRTRLGIGAK